jgi:hypothetical protein
LVENPVTLYLYNWLFLLQSKASGLCPRLKKDQEKALDNAIFENRQAGSLWDCPQHVALRKSIETYPTANTMYADLYLYGYVYINFKLAVSWKKENIYLA